jgi:hypothetical protein
VRGARGIWVFLVLAGVAAVVVANVALLGLASERHDPVGRLQPVTTLDLGPATGTVPGVTTTDTGTQTEPDDHGHGSGHDGRDD